MGDTASARTDMRVPARLDAGEEDQFLNQLMNISTLPGITKAAIAMPDARQGYGFPIGGVAEEATLAYKEVLTVVNTVEQAGLAEKAVKMLPVAVIKGYI